MLTFRNKYLSHGKYDQNGEFGVINECIKRIGITNGRCSEWGANNGLYCSNTRHLLEKGWKGTMIEYDANLYNELVRNTEGLDCICVHSAVDPGNVNTFTKGDVCSLDTDGVNDWQCFQFMTDTPSIIVIEINSGYNPSEDRLQEGANYSIMAKLAKQKGYFVVAHTGNLILVRNDWRELFPEIIGDGIDNYKLYFDYRWIK